MPCRSIPEWSAADPFQALVHIVSGSTPDFVGSQALIHDQTGKPFMVTMGVSLATWQGNGSPPSQAHFQLVDLTA